MKSSAVVKENKDKRTKDKKNILTTNIPYFLTTKKKVKSLQSKNLILFTVFFSSNQNGFNNSKIIILCVILIWLKL